MCEPLLWDKASLDPPENQRVSLHVQVTLAGEEVQPEKAVVAPAFTDLKVGGKLPNDVLGRVAGSLMNHFNTVLISAKIHFIHIRLYTFLKCKK